MPKGPQGQKRPAELVEARDRVRRQIEVLEAGPSYRSVPQYAPLLAQLRAVLAGIESELADSGLSDA